MCHDLRRGGKAHLRACADAEVQVVHAAAHASAAYTILHNEQQNVIYLARCTDGLLHPETMTDPATTDATSGGCRERALCSYVVSLVNGHKLKATSAASS